MEHNTEARNKPEPYQAEPGRPGSFTRNMGNVDRVLRLAVALGLLFILIPGRITGIAAVLLWVLGGILVLTGIFGMCPLYRLLGIARWEHCNQAGSRMAP